jgi:hypothetical protein
MRFVGYQDSRLWFRHHASPVESVWPAKRSVNQKILPLAGSG